MKVNKFLEKMEKNIPGADVWRKKLENNGTMQQTKTPKKCKWQRLQKILSQLLFHVTQKEKGKGKKCESMGDPKKGNLF
jgi:hypothetical protein